MQRAGGAGPRVGVDDPVLSLLQDLGACMATLDEGAGSSQDIPWHLVQQWCPLYTSHGWVTWLCPFMLSVHFVQSLYMLGSLQPPCSPADAWQTVAWEQEFGEAHYQSHWDGAKTCLC